MAELRQIVRIINADVLGTKQIAHALTAVSGIGPSFAASICNTMHIDHRKKIGSLSPDEVKKIEEVIKNPGTYNIPRHVYNRQRDPETGLDKHIITSDLKLSKEFDVKMMKKIKSYKGIRHALGLPVRGQKTRSHFRKGKSVGVVKKKAEAAKKSKEEKK